jgi:hypothetical protein
LTFRGIARASEEIAMKPHRLWASVAALSVVAAAAGGALAESHSASNTVSACVHRRDGVLYMARKCAGHDRRTSWSMTGPMGAQGPAGPQGPPAATLFAQVTPDGTLGAASPGVQKAKVGTGMYELDFGRDISTCVASVQQGGIPAGAGATTSIGDGAAHASIMGPGATSAGGFPSGDTVLVSTIDQGVPADSSFQIAIFC